MSVFWKVRLAAQAELDFSEIITWTLENFGERQAETYAETLTLAIEAKDQYINVLRLLHDSMDLARHIPPANDQSH